MIVDLRGNYRSGIASLRGLNSLFPNNIGLPVGSSGSGAGGTTTSNDPVLNTGRRTDGTPCAPCPSSCRTEKTRSTYYAHPTKTSADDIPITVNKKVVKCNTAVTSSPRLDCAEELIALKKANGLQGLSGCTACGSYSNRM